MYSLVLERGKAGAGGEADTGDGSLLACPHSVPLKTGTISSTWDFDIAYLTYSIGIGIVYIQLCKGELVVD